MVATLRDCDKQTKHIASWQRYHKYVAAERNCDNGDIQGYTSQLFDVLEGKQLKKDALDDFKKGFYPEYANEKIDLAIVKSHVFKK
eukprot:CAMPEP_0114993130 /NCGR_PEP_ID=MMETSP0216-20121206/12348_1 /TAXON_ID=223996 /ORGANISM="Protocruzia adherens, Strain Boccale" /LENGTH=85 /DNA_ID=CAMNT_0002356717 /DNA_START=123 /DNA_END=380 /DNA_ORIENTATION=+